MRAFLFVLILIVAAVLVAVWTGFLDISQVRPARAPDVKVGTAGVSARNGQAPAFDIETGSLAVGTKSANVTVPTVKVVPPAANSGQQGQPAQNRSGQPN